MIFEKKAINIDNFLLSYYSFTSARMGIQAFLKQCLISYRINSILLPDYIGISPNEGSGIFDAVSSIPVISRYYYKLNRDLSINIPYLEKCIKNHEGCLFFIVNYFGNYDRNYEVILKMAKEENCIILEDNAHGFFSYLSNSFDIKADATVFSFHKLFPVDTGGALLIRNTKFKLTELHPGFDFNPFMFDIEGIAMKRKENYRYLLETILDLNCSSLFYPLISNFCGVPQSFPIIICSDNRNDVYFDMNKKGYGVVSLYHTLINEIPLNSDTQYVASHILNLPIHQDIDPKQYKEFLNELLLSVQK
jgi:dTDP-4-amino-4,6-dideoxygalactose transaminase